MALQEKKKIGFPAADKWKNDLNMSAAGMTRGATLPWGNEFHEGFDFPVLLHWDVDLIEDSGVQMGNGRAVVS